MTFGDPDTVGAEPEECRRILDAYAEAGGNVVDTAINYRGGARESIPGELLKGRRDRFVVSTKYTVSRDGSDPNADKKNACRSIRASAACARTTSTSLGAPLGCAHPDRGNQGRRRRRARRQGPLPRCLGHARVGRRPGQHPRGPARLDPIHGAPSAIQPLAARHRTRAPPDGTRVWHERRRLVAARRRHPLRQVHAPGWARTGNQGLAGHAHRTRPGRGPERRRDRQRSGSERIAGRDRLDESTVERGPSHRRDRSPRSAGRQSRRGRLHAAARGTATSRRCVRLRRRLRNRLHQRNKPWVFGEASARVDRR